MKHESDVKRLLDTFASHERAERWFCFIATGFAIGITLGAFVQVGFFAGVACGVCFLMGVVAQRA